MNPCYRSRNVADSERRELSDKRVSERKVKLGLGGGDAEDVDVEVGVQFQPLF